MDTFTELSLVIGIAAVIGGVMKLLKQPLILGHILTGIIVGPYFLNIFQNRSSGEIFSQMGISILLFIVGLSLSPKVIKDVGRVSIITGLCQILFTSAIGFVLAMAFGFGVIPSLYIAVALTFGSTIIVLKLLTDRKDTEKLYGRIAIGFLLVQDLVAALILILVSTLSVGGNIVQAGLLVIIKGLAATLILSLISYYVLPKLSTFFASSQEYLFIFGISWGLGMAAIFRYIGFSYEIGGLIAGVTLSISPYAKEISAKLKPLRDFFILLFFILLGAGLDLSKITVILVPAIVFSFYVLIGNPLIVYVILSLLGFNKSTSFRAGLTVAQVSEFSLILVLMAVKLRHVTSTHMALVTLVALITISASSYLIIYEDITLKNVARFLPNLTRARKKIEINAISNFEVILFGCNRAGYDFIHAFKSLGPAFLAVDFNPDTISELKKSGINAEYGDAEDADFLEEIKIVEAKLVISTIPDFETNLFLLSKIRKSNPASGVIFLSYNLDQALILYENGASYVVLPHFIGGKYVADFAKNALSNFGSLDAKRIEHIAYLKERKAAGHSHPVWAHHY